MACKSQSECIFCMKNKLKRINLAEKFRNKADKVSEKTKAEETTKIVVFM